jgi:hypothetical protein
VTQAGKATMMGLQTALAHAGDAQLGEIVSLAERLDDRADAEELLVPIRPKLRLLRLERPLRFSRLLALPLEPVLTSAGRWTKTAVTLPRAAMKPLAAVVSARAPAMAAQVRSMITGATTRNTLLMAEAGAVLWPAAALVLDDGGATPSAWTEAGLPDAAYAPTAAAVAACLSLATQLGVLSDPTLGATQVELALGTALRQAARKGPTAWGMMVALLVCRVPHAPLPRSLLLHQAAAAQLRPSAVAALDHVWQWIEEATELAGTDLAEAAAALHQRAVLLDALAAEKTFRPQAGALQAALRTTYTQHLAEAARERVSARLAAMTSAPDDAAMMQLEIDARGLRRLALEIRGLGGTAQADGVVRDLAREAARCQALPAVDRARLVEILDETDAAVRAVPGIIEG